MIYILFFYDMVMTGANVTLCVVFTWLFVRRKDLLHLWLAILFGICTLDIILMYMLDFVPDFSSAFQGVVELAPSAYTLLHIAILFMYRLIAGRIAGKNPQNREAIIWIVCLTGIVVGASLPWPSIAVFAEGIGMGLLQLLIGLVGYRGLRNGAADSSVLGRQKTIALVATFVVCSVGYVFFTFYGLFLNTSDPRNPFVELSGAINLTFAVIYLVAYRNHENKATTAMVAAGIAKRYDLTKREEEILCMLADGMSNQEIGSKAYISVGTVKTHVHNIYAKLGIKGRSNLDDFIQAEAIKPPEGFRFPRG